MSVSKTKRSVVAIGVALTMVTLSLAVPGVTAAQSGRSKVPPAKRVAPVRASADVAALEARVAALEAQLAAAADAFRALAARTPEGSARAATIDQFVTIVTGPINGLPGPHIVITGANLHLRNGLGDTGLVNGLGNLVVGYNEVPANDPLAPGDRGGSHSVVIGPGHRYSAGGGLVAGLENTVSGSYATVSGGFANTASSLTASVSGGFANTASGLNASVSGGNSNIASGDHASVSGGGANEASGGTASVSGGEFNTASGSAASVGGGSNNTASEYATSVSGGSHNTASGSAASVTGGDMNTASGDRAGVSGGASLTADAANCWRAGTLNEGGCTP